MIFLTKSCNDKEIKEANVPDRRIRGNIEHITVNAVEEDFRRPYLVRTKRNQRTDQECKETVGHNFKSFVDNFQSHWEERRDKIKKLKKEYVSAC